MVKEAIEAWLVSVMKNHVKTEITSVMRQEIETAAELEAQLYTSVEQWEVACQVAIVGIKSTLVGSPFSGHGDETDTSIAMRFVALTILDGPHMVPLTPKIKSKVLPV